MFVPLSCPRAFLFPPCAFLCLFVYAMCALVVVSVSTPLRFPISRFVCIIGFTCVLLIPRSVDDAINIALHYILQHLDNRNTDARVLFVDYSSAFNTIIPDLLHSKLTHLNIHPLTRLWITDFLTNRR